MFLARIAGTLTSTTKHPTLQRCRFLMGERVESNGQASGEPLVLLDRLGAGYGSTVLVSTDGDIARKWLGNNTPSRMVVVAIVDAVSGADVRAS